MSIKKYKTTESDGLRTAARKPNEENPRKTAK